jgi:sulfoxide reductase catalytic subunit YedY
MNIDKKAFPKPDDKINAWEDITSYNNFYEFGTDKDDPERNAKNFRTQPWTVSIEGECNKKGVMNLEDVLKGETLEQRIYRHRCVEGWSMVIPWVGFPLGNLVKRLEPTSKAKFVEFTSLADSKQMIGVRMPILAWPYREGLRMDEAMHPLALMVVGLYDEVLPNQDGAPLRLAVPWKYGFKHIKSIVKIKFVEKAPLNTWQEQASNEYGFYANVNPTVDHPRWSQATERRIGEFFRRKTLMFNGYGDQVASLYTGMDLRKNY